MKHCTASELGFEYALREWGWKFDTMEEAILNSSSENHAKQLLSAIVSVDQGGAGL